VLLGQFEVTLQNLCVVLEKGALIGEMNFFDGGQRTASVVCAEAGTLAGAFSESCSRWRAAPS
jgi:hypothetical protein